MVSREAKERYEAGSSRCVETTTNYCYDEYGNVIDLYDNGTTGESTQRVHARIAYDYGIPGTDYQKQSPSSIRVEDSTGSLMRLRQGTYGSCGELLRLDQYDDAGLPVPVQRDCTRGPVMMPSGRVLPKPPGSTGDEPMPAGTAPAPPPGSPPDGVLVRERDWGYVTGRRTFVNDEIALSVTIRRSAACRVRAPICATRLVNRRKARRHD